MSDLNTILQKSRLIGEERIKEQEKDLRLLDKKMQELTEQKATCLEDYHAGVLKREQFQEKRNEITQKFEEVKAEHEVKKKEMEQQIKSMNKLPKDSEGLLSYSGMECLTREMVEAFADYIKIDGKMNIDIYWEFNNQVAGSDDCITTG